MSDLDLVVITDETNELVDNYIYKSSQILEVIPPMFYVDNPANIIVMRRADNKTYINKRGISYFEGERNKILDSSRIIDKAKNGLYLVNIELNEVIFWKDGNEWELTKHNGWSRITPNYKSFSTNIIVSESGKLYKAAVGVSSLIFLLSLISMSGLTHQPIKDIDGIMLLIEIYSKRYNLIPIDYNDSIVKSTAFPETVEAIVKKINVDHSLQLKETQFKEIKKLINEKENTEPLVLPLPEKVLLSQILDEGITFFSNYVVDVEVDIYQSMIESAYMLKGEICVEPKTENDFNKLTEIIGESVTVVYPWEDLENQIKGLIC